MLGILLKIISAAFPFIREMLFGRSATGRTHMISFLIICNIALGISFFITAKITVGLHLSERKHRSEITRYKTEIETLNAELTKSAHTCGTVAETISMYSRLLADLSYEKAELRGLVSKAQIELSTCKAQTPIDVMRR